MKLYTNPASPFCRKVEAILIETGLDARVDRELSKGNPVTPGTMPVGTNPLGKIPALVGAKGEAVFDSRVICRYLDALAGANLYPEHRLWQVLTLEALGDGISDAGVSMSYEVRARPEEKQFAAWMDAQWTKIARALDVVEESWIDWLDGPPTVAHFALGSALGYLDFRHGARGWRTGRPKLADWQASFDERPSMAATRPRDAA
ncbi:glutathione S-transferase family protein [Silicimonas algicola]|uniref:Glutathione S-transferase n=1 Tax=Silicimonas algicola TaxID=1826607 RepID=A0A316GEB4_9RHOB|nr:glutathione S-transferase family protein [Silicimonas algicola]AZQ66562.1 glutathione S-transferase family protein [Silicimonas algicola]PWK58903.1 glutathione S-transferase [Silicimonas algicola]